MNIIRDRAVVEINNPFSKLPVGSITAKGWLREQLLRSKAGMGGHLDELEPDMIANAFLTHSSFKTFRGQPADPTFAAGWSSEISGTYWTGLTQMAFALQDEELIQKVTTWVEGVLKNQEEDGYLGGYSKEADRMADYNPWGANWCYRALLAFFEKTNRRDVLEAVHRGLLWFCENWKDHKTDYGAAIIIESMIIVYAYTGDKRLVEFSEDFLVWLEKNSRHQNKVSQYLSDDLPYKSMHTVAYGEHVKNPALVWCATGEERMLKASLNGMEKALKKIIHPTGGAGSNAEHLSPVSAEGEVEYCNFPTYNQSWGWLAMATGEARWGDEIERCTFNGAEGARKKDERAIAYFTSPNQVFATKSSATYATWVDNEVYAPCYYVACCPVQSIRILPEFVRSMCMIDRANELYMLCYGPAAITAPKLDLEMDTMYPFRENITLKISRAEPGAKLYLRIPSWCEAPVLSRGGKQLNLKMDGKGFAQVEEVLAAGDELQLYLPMKVELLKIDDSDVAAKYPICVRRGPLVYSIPIPERWEAYRGDPITPLPDDWSWFEVFPVTDDFGRADWGKAIDEDLSPEAVVVKEHEPEGYVWENPPVTLEVPLKKTRYNYLHCELRNFEPYGVTQETEGEDIQTKLVPYGCTALRITFIPRQKK